MVACHPAGTLLLRPSQLPGGPTETLPRPPAPQVWVPLGNIYQSQIVMGSPTRPHSSRDTKSNSSLQSPRVEVEQNALDARAGADK